MPSLLPVRLALVGVDLSPEIRTERAKEREKLVGEEMKRPRNSDEDRKSEREGAKEQERDKTRLKERLKQRDKSRKDSLKERGGKKER